MTIRRLKDVEVVVNLRTLGVAHLGDELALVALVSLQWQCHNDDGFLYEHDIEVDDDETSIPLVVLDRIIKRLERDTHWSVIND